MSEGRDSMELSEFFNDDDSEGHRFVDFIKKRRGSNRKQKFLFMDCETDRMSFEVQLEKLPTPQAKTNCAAIDKNMNGTSPAAENFEFSKPRPVITKRQSGVNNTSPVRLESSSRVRRKGVAVSPSDCLRRLSMKNNSSKKVAGGRRTLLEEFEGTMQSKNFNPLLCSTPISHQSENDPNPLCAIGNTEVHNEKSSIPGASCCGNSDTLMKALKRKDDELKGYMDRDLDKTYKNKEDQSICNRTSHGTSLGKRTFTVEKGNVPGQLVLTPDRCNADSNRISEPSNSLKQKNHTKSNLQSCQHSIHNCKGTAHEGVRSGSSARSLSQREILETQTNTTGNNIIICSGNEQNVVVIPLNRTINTITNQERNNNCKNPQITSDSAAVQNQSIQEAGDNLKLTDILTDDEDNTPKTTVENAQSVSEMPLNLAQSSFNLRSKKLRKRTLKRDLNEANTQQLTCETEVKVPPPAHSKRQIDKTKYKPLNKAPGMPLNGEKYAQELARMSNHEILDLRKRNSMGHIFSALGRPSRRSLEEVNKKKQRLDEQIKEELLKRNLDDITQPSSCQSDRENVEVERLSVPYNFRDFSAGHQKVQNDLNNSSFVDENSSDRIKFKDNKSRIDNQKIPEVLQQYLEVSKRYSKGKRRKRERNMSKRPLYKVQVGDESHEHDSLTENSSYAERTRSTTFRRLSVTCLKSPPKISDLLTTPKVVSPPPPVCTSSVEMQNTTAGINRAVVAITSTTDETENTPHTDVVVDRTIKSVTQNSPYKICTDVENLTLPPPPPGFECHTNEYTGSVTLELRTADGSIQKNVNTNNDDNLFKKPLKPVPKRKVKKAHNTLNVPQESAVDNQSAIDSSSDLREGGSLRRSKRGQVPKSQPTILKILYENEIKRMELYHAKRKATIKNQSKAEKISQKLTSKSGNSKSSKRTTNSPPTDSASRSTKSAKKVKSTKGKPKQAHNNVTRGDKDDQLSSNENMQDSRLILDSSPQVEHLNSMFDQLQQDGLTSNATAAPGSSQFKTKPIKVRIRRLQPSEKPPNNISNESSSSTNSTIDFVSWLKNISKPYEDTDEEFKDGIISSATSLCFTELQGVEYAFYDTAVKASLGYLRFKPRQIKSKKKAKLFTLHFINLMGLFQIKVNNSESVLAVGDMAAVEKLSYYDIENLTDDIGILMVIKK